VLRFELGEDKANMASALALRAQIEAALADRIPSALTPAPRMVRPVVPTGMGAVDELLQGGLPVGALTEMVGAECSGRTSLALKFVAQVTRAEKVCAWVDVSDALSPESAAACGVDLARLLWVRCGVVRKPTSQKRDVGHPASGRNGFAVPQKYFVPKPVVKGLHGGGMGGHPRGEAKGMDAAVSGLLQQDVSARCAEPQRRVRVEREVVAPVRVRDFASGGRAKFGGGGGTPGRPWGRIEQALKVTDLLLQAGGFGAIVLDMGSLAPEHVSRIPLATWFRYRAGAERTQACVLLLTQHTCAKSSTGLVLRMTTGDAVTAGATVLAGFERRVEVARRRFAESAERLEKVVPIRKPPQRAGVATWRSHTAWLGDERGSR
jgi:recombination protein RecA